MMTQCELQVSGSPEKSAAGYPATDIQAYWGTDVTPLKKRTGLYFSAACISETVLRKEEIGKRIRALIQKHPALRAVFFREGKRCCQRIGADAAFLVETCDLRGGAPRTGTALRPEQEAQIRKYYTEALERLAASAERIPLFVSCCRTGENEALWLLIMDHSVSDGVSIRIILNELISGNTEGGEDHYPDYLRYLQSDECKREAAEYWNNMEHSGASEPVPETGETGFSFDTEKIILGRDALRDLQPYCDRKKVSVVSLLLFAYGQAALKALDLETGVFSLLSSGRHIGVSGMESAVGCFVRDIPVRLSREDSPADFKRRYREAERYSFVSDELMWKNGRENAIRLPLSEVFGEEAGKTAGCEYALEDYGRMQVNSFIVREDDGLCVYLHRDKARFGKAAFDELASTMRKFLWDCMRAYAPMTLQTLVRERLNDTREIAVQCGAESVTGERLRTDAGKLGRVLALRGIGPGSGAVLKMRRTEKLIPALYGLFYAGAAVIPVPSEIPPERLRVILASSKAKLILTDEKYDELMRAALPDDCPEPDKALPEAPALIIYTSGSTAEPKGVCHTQAEEAATFLQFPSAVQLAGLKTGCFETVISRTEVSYNLFYHIECPAPLTGRKLILLNESEQNDTLRAAGILSGNRRAAMVFTPSLLDVYLENDSFRKAFSSAALAVTAGEAAGASLLGKLGQLPRDLCLLSLYGSTECQSISWADLREISRGGLPLPDTSVRVIKDGRTAGANEEGEICVCSDTVSGSFVNGGYPPTVKLMDRIYQRTGDLGVLTEEGRLLVRGRLDRGLKLHGQRIDPREIEQRMKTLDGVDECAVVLKKSQSGEFLAVYYRGEREWNARQLRTAFRDALPSHMIPSLCVRLPAFPVTANGKLDLRRLAEMPFMEEKSGQDRPLDEREAMTAALTADVLGIDGSGLSGSADLFACGLDSIRALTLISALRERGWCLKLQDYYADPTVAGIAKALRPEDRASAEVPFDFPATPVQSDWAARAEQNDRINGLYIFRIYLAGRAYSEEEFRQRMKTVVENHPALRTLFARDQDGAFRQTLSDDSRVRYEFEDIRRLRAETDRDILGVRQEGYLRMYAYRLGDRYLGKEAGEDIALHVSALRLSDEASAFVIMLNHTRADGMTGRILLRELLAPGLPARADGYAACMAYVFNEENRRKAAEFWKDYLKGANPACVPLCADPKETPAPAFETIQLDAPQTERFRKVCRENGVSVPIMVNYLYGKALLKTLREERIIFEVLMHGRDLPVCDPARTVGCLTERVPVVVSETDRIRDFMNGLTGAGSFGFLPMEEMFYAAWKKKIRPPLAKAIVSEVDPVVTGDCFCREYNPVDRQHLRHEHYLVEDPMGIRVIFHYNGHLHDGSFFRNLADRMKTFMLTEDS